MHHQLVLNRLDVRLPDGTMALENISFKLAKGARLSILGPSGSGKTTLLRCIAGLIPPCSGTMFFNNQPLISIPAHQRNFGLMFQDYALFPHLNVAENIAFGLKMKKTGSRTIQQRVADMLDLVKLGGFEKRRVDELSGGEQQRVALARTLACEPELLMLDEPLSSIDRVLRKKLLGQMMDIISLLKITTIFVPHDHEEAKEAGDQLMLINEGRVVQTGTYDDITAAPAGRWVRDFLSL